MAPSKFVLNTLAAGAFHTGFGILSTLGGGISPDLISITWPYDHRTLLN